jgi:hypothetical protein
MSRRRLGHGSTLVPAPRQATHSGGLALSGSHRPSAGTAGAADPGAGGSGEAAVCRLPSSVGCGSRPTTRRRSRDIRRLIWPPAQGSRSGTPAPHDRVGRNAADAARLRRCKGQCVRLRWAPAAQQAPVAQELAGAGPARSSEWVSRAAWQHDLAERSGGRLRLAAETVKGGPRRRGSRSCWPPARGDGAGFRAVAVPFPVHSACPRASSGVIEHQHCRAHSPLRYWLSQELCACDVEAEELSLGGSLRPVEPPHGHARRDPHPAERPLLGYRSPEGVLAPRVAAGLSHRRMETASSRPPASTRRSVETRCGPRAHSAVTVSSSPARQVTRGSRRREISAGPSAAA